MPKAQKAIRAEYIGGVFKPLDKVHLPEGEKVEIQIKGNKSKKIQSLRGIWRGIEISEEDLEKGRSIWEKGVEKQIRVLGKEPSA
jgi:predicted DNA-binding antitoxin AbrB/MazE fold protein